MDLSTGSDEAMQPHLIKGRRHFGCLENRRQRETQVLNPGDH